MANSFIILFLTAFSFSALAAAPVSKLITIARDNKYTTRMAYTFWSGEYPSPVIDLSSTVVGKSKITVERNYEILGKTATCTVDNGLYHPWSLTANSDADYMTISALQEYILTGAFDFETTSYDQKSGDIKTVKIAAHKGDVITRVAYLGEGYCSAELIYQPNLQRSEVDFFCGDIDDSTVFKETRQHQKDGFSEQWITVNCAEGFKGYITDKNFLASPGARQGRILAHGEVGPAEVTP